MKITGFETIPIQQRALLLKMHTDEGITGYGEPMDYTHWRIVAQAVEDMAEYLIGKDPLQIEDHWQTFFRSTYSRSMPSILGALSGIDMAMWDVMGKKLGVPVWKLLGGSVRDRVRVYTHVGGSSLEALAENARKAVAQGFSAMKMSIVDKPVRFIDTPGAVQKMVARVAAVREAVGDKVDIAVDLHRRFSPTMAIQVIKELEPLKLLSPKNPATLRTIKPYRTLLAQLQHRLRQVSGIWHVGDSGRSSKSRHARFSNLTSDMWAESPSSGKYPTWPKSGTWRSLPITPLENWGLSPRYTQWPPFPTFSSAKAERAGEKASSRTLFNSRTVSSNCPPNLGLVLSSRMAYWMN